MRIKSSRENYGFFTISLLRASGFHGFTDRQPDLATGYGSGVGDYSGPGQGLYGHPQWEDQGGYAGSAAEYYPGHQTLDLQHAMQMAMQQERERAYGLWGGGGLPQSQQGDNLDFGMFTEPGYYGGAEHRGGPYLNHGGYGAPFYANHGGHGGAMYPNHGGHGIMAGGDFDYRSRSPMEHRGSGDPYHLYPGDLGEDGSRDPLSPPPQTQPQATSPATKVPVFTPALVSALGEIVSRFNKNTATYVSWINRFSGSAPARYATFGSDIKKIMNCWKASAMDRVIADAKNDICVAVNAIHMLAVDYKTVNHIEEAVLANRGECHADITKVLGDLFGENLPWSMKVHSVSGNPFDSIKFKQVLASKHPALERVNAQEEEIMNLQASAQRIVINTIGALNHVINQSLASVQQAYPLLAVNKKSFFAARKEFKAAVEAAASVDGVQEHVTTDICYDGNPELDWILENPKADNKTAKRRVEDPWAEENDTETAAEVNIYQLLTQGKAKGTGKDSVKTSARELASLFMKGSSATKGSNSGEDTSLTSFADLPLTDKFVIGAVLQPLYSALPYNNYAQAQDELRQKLTTLEELDSTVALLTKILCTVPGDMKRLVNTSRLASMCTRTPTGEIVRKALS